MQKYGLFDSTNVVRGVKLEAAQLLHPSIS